MVFFHSSRRESDYVVSPSIFERASLSSSDETLVLSCVQRRYTSPPPCKMQATKKTLWGFLRCHGTDLYNLAAVSLICSVLECSKPSLRARCRNLRASHGSCEGIARSPSPFRQSEINDRLLTPRVRTSSAPRIPRSALTAATRK